MAVASGAGERVASPMKGSPKNEDGKNESSPTKTVKTAADKFKEGIQKSGASHDNDGKTESPQRTLEKLVKTTLISACTWDVFTPPPSNTFTGKLVPKIVNRYRKRRKLSLEIHRITPLVKEEGKNEGTEEEGSYDECVLRILDPRTQQKAVEAKREAFTKAVQEKGTSEIYNSVRELDAELDDDDDDDATVLGQYGGALADTGGKVFDDWKPLYRFPCESVTVQHQQKKSVFLMLRVEDVKQEREIIFDTLEDATKFCQRLDEEHKLEAVRTEARLQASLGDITLVPGEKVTLLIEIVSGWNLPIGDKTTSDPYVVCLFGRREVHRTQHISCTLEPIWTINTGSLFLFTVEAREFFIEKGLKLLVKDYDQFGMNETLGIVTVPPNKLYRGNGERMEFKVMPPPHSRDKEVPGHLAIRCRRATEYDKQFMTLYEKSLKAVASPAVPPTVNSAIRSILTTNQKVDHGIKKYKVRPEPDPKRPEETEWMTDDELQAEVMKPSRNWMDAGSGELGRVYLEILGCDDLPNLDVGGFLGNKTDAFVSVVFEDVFVRTHTISDCLSPRWLPWTTRAFIFNISHPSSCINIGIFDYDGGIDDHDLIGRVSVDITNLKKDTVYNLKYDIFSSAVIAHSERKSKGKVHIRLRIEIPDERKMALAVLEPPKPTYVNVKKRKDFRVIRQTCLGKYDTSQYSLSTLKSYLDELREYQLVLSYLEDAVMSLLLWHGHFPMKIFSKEILLPVHSFNAFVVATTLVERPQLFPSFCFASIAWVLIAVMGYRRRNPYVWSRCISFGEIMQKLVLGECTTPPDKIEPFQGYLKAKQALELWTKRVADAEEAAQRKYLEAQREEEQRLKELEEIGDADADISTKVGGGVTLDPIKAALFPVQQQLEIVCRALRFVKHVISWEEPYFSFWITAGSALLAIACSFVPWFFIIQWTSRILVWTIFGPWMKLTDIFYFSTLEPETEAERAARELRLKIERELATTKAAAEARLTRENAAKMKDMKKYMFGKFSMKVPLLKQDRFEDEPLPESSAQPYEQKSLTLAELAMQEAGYNRTRMPGQNLVGEMIPMVETQAFTKAPTGKATANPEALSKTTPGGGQKKKSDSTATAYVKIASIVALASVLTFFTVPILASYTEFWVGLVHKIDETIP